MSFIGDKSFLLEVAKGNVPGHSIVNKFGHNVAVPTIGADVWSGGGDYTFYPTTAQSMELVSDSAADAVGGTGATSIIVYGLDTNWEEVSEIITPTGTTPVALANTYRRMYRGIILTAGTNETNVGNISVQISGGGIVGVHIAANDGQTQQTNYTIPAGKTGYFMKGYVATSDDDKNGEAAEFQWKARPNNGVTGAWSVKGQMGLNTIGSSNWQYEYGAPAGPLPEKTDIKIRCFLTTATLGVVGGYDLVLVDD